MYHNLVKRQYHCLSTPIKINNQCKYYLSTEFYYFVSLIIARKTDIYLKQCKHNMKSFNEKQKYTLQHFFIFLFILIIEEQQNIVNVHKVAFVTTIEPQMGGRSRRRNFQSILLEYEMLFGQRSSFSFLLEKYKIRGHWFKQVFLLP